MKNVEEVKLAKITSAENENKHKCSSCTLYIVLFSIIFTINIGIGTYFQWYLKKMLLMLSLVPVLKQWFNKLINGRSQTNRDQKLNLLFLQRHFYNFFQSQKFRLKLVKNRQKALERD